MEIKILGPGCPNCQDLERRVKQALSELKTKAELSKVSDFSEISKYVIMTPGVVINGKVRHEGKPLPRVEEIKKWMLEEQNSC